ncbi:MAG: redox-regulated ATPase YchF [Fervidicoccaceae archaeon]|jgi:ribosome-binding ATPase YchF (GTP1/OBG family)|uniref:Redox-regulated ATPase YchF n=1 Tax=Fervidicoccus fontis TaxID=683846 RepID=A0A7C2YZC2_9CREN|nr:MAG: redox-regulated ATPase YchF [Fervidicoccus sp.]HEU97593.1 redox-regulated ATPase YchF [Fervidicoccus fontis]
MKLVNYSPPLVGIVGKTNVGKSTLFSAISMASVEISNRPFTTIEPNKGVGYVRVQCPHVDFSLPKCDPRSGYCVKGNRFIPVDLIDVAGLIPGAHLGKGLGNKFMDDLRKADAFLLVIDASGSTDENGNPVPPGTSDPVKEVRDILYEIDMWIARIVSSDWQKFSVSVETARKDISEAIFEKISGLSVKRGAVVEALERSGLFNTRPSSWRQEDFYRFAKELRKAAKPHVIVANKADLPISRENIERLRKEFPEEKIFPVSAEAELALKKAAKAGIIEYVPGDPGFSIPEPSRLNRQQMSALKYINERVIATYGGTGVQQALNFLIFEVLRKIVIFPVEDPTKLTDKDGRILPDALLVDRDSNPKVVAGLVHSDLEKGFLYAIDARTKQRLGADSKLSDRAVIKIVSSI